MLTTSLLGDLKCEIKWWSERCEEWHWSCVMF